MSATSSDATEDESAAGVESVCVLTNEYLLGWQVRALERMLAETDVDVPLVVVNATGDVDESGFSRGASQLGADAYDNPHSVGLSDVKLFFKLLSTEGVWTAVLAEKKLSWMLGGYEPDLMKRHRYNTVDALEDADVVRCRPVPVEGEWCDLPGEVVDRVVAETDVAVRFGFSLLTGRIITEPEHGVLSFHPADVRRYRGLGPVQPFLNDDDTAGTTLQQLTDDLDGGNVLAIEHVDISDDPPLGEIRRRLNLEQTGMLATGIERLNDPSFELQPPDELGTYTSVENRQSPAFAARVLAKNIRRRIARRLSGEPKSPSPPPVDREDPSSPSTQ